MFKLAVFLAVAAVASANVAYSNAPAQGYKAAPAYRPAPKVVSYQPQQSYDAPAQYNFNWAVNDGYGNDFGQTESRNGDNTDGSFTVLLPDGRRQTTNYYVNGYSGFVADVKYDGEARYDTPAPAYKPAPVAYKPAPVAYRPAPVVYQAAPAPRIYSQPAPRVYSQPAPRVYSQPAPVVYQQASRVYSQPAPVAQVYRQAPASITYA